MCFVHFYGLLAFERCGVFDPRLIKMDLPELKDVDQNSHARVPLVKITHKCIVIKGILTWKKFYNGRGLSCWCNLHVKPPCEEHQFPTAPTMVKSTPSESLWNYSSPWDKRNGKFLLKLERQCFLEVSMMFMTWMVGDADPLNHSYHVKGVFVGWVGYGWSLFKVRPFS